MMKTNYLKRILSLTLALLALLFSFGVQMQADALDEIPSDAIHINNNNILTIDWTKNGKYYVLEEDIKLQAEWAPINNFAGSVFDGQGHTISGLYVSKSVQYAGLFGLITANDVTIKDLGVIAASQGVSASWSAGGIVGEYRGTGTMTVQNCYTTGKVSSPDGAFAGGLVGAVITGGSLIISGCCTSGDVSANNISKLPSTYCAGGLIGYYDGTKSVSITDCYTRGTVSALADNAYAGGLIGYYGGTQSLKIQNCYAAGNVSTNTSQTSYVSYAGGLIGYIKNKSLLTVTSCYRLKPQTVTGKTVNEVGVYLDYDQQNLSSSFVGWDFDTIWGFRENINRPDLRAFNNDFVVLRAPKITTESPLPDAIIGIPYDFKLRASGDPPIIWELDNDALPDGLSLSAEGLISGTPTSSPRKFDFKVRATNTAGSYTKDFSITVKIETSVDVDKSEDFLDALNGDAEKINITEDITLDDSITIIIDKEKHIIVAAGKILTINGDLTIKDKLTVDGKLIVNGKLTVNGELIVNGLLTANGETLIEGEAHIEGNIEINSDTVLRGKMIIR